MRKSFHSAVSFASMLCCGSLHFNWSRMLGEAAFPEQRSRAFTFSGFGCVLKLSPANTQHPTATINLGSTRPTCHPSTLVQTALLAQYRHLEAWPQPQPSAQIQTQTQTQTQTQKQTLIAARMESVERMGKENVSLEHAINVFSKKTVVMHWNHSVHSVLDLIKGVPMTDPKERGGLFRV